MASLDRATSTCLSFINILFSIALFHANHSLAAGTAIERNVSSVLVLGIRPSRASYSLPAHQKASAAGSSWKFGRPTEVVGMMEPLREVRDGYLISLNIGNPPQVIQVYMDTGSDLTWVPCGNLSFDCIDCDEYRKDKFLINANYAYSPSYSSSSYRDSCASPFCIDIHSSDNSLDACTVAGCSLSTLVKAACSRPCPSFAYTYGAGGVVTGTLTRDTLRVHGIISSSTSLIPTAAAAAAAATREIPNFCFGCIGSSYREPIGIGGFGRGTLSLPSQMGLLHKGFSHCFLPFKYAYNPNISSPLLIGDVALSSSGDHAANNNNNMQFTPMLRSPMYPNYYYIGLEAVAIQAKAAAAGTTSSSDSSSSSSSSSTPTQTHIEVVAPLRLREFDSKGNGGMLIDSGTTYTHLPEPVYSQLLSALQSMINYPRATQVELRTGFDLCYGVPSPTPSPTTNHNYNNTTTTNPTLAVAADDHHDHEEDLFPSITFHFLNNVSLVLPQDNQFYAMSAPRNSSVVKCLLIQSMDEDEDARDGDYYGPAGVFGSFQQQNVQVLYDLENERIGFQPTDCAAAAASFGLVHNLKVTDHPN